MENREVYFDVPQRVLDWLFQVLQPNYYDPRTCFHDVVALLSNVKSLAPRSRVFTNKIGGSELLLCLYGKIEDVDILIWVPSEYPIMHPMVYIDFELINGHELQVSQYLDSEGLFYLPIFASWNPEECNLLKVVFDLRNAIRRNFPLKVLQRPPQVPQKLQSFEVRTDVKSPSLPPKVPSSSSSKSTSKYDTPGLPPKPPRYTDTEANSILTRMELMNSIDSLGNDFGDLHLSPSASATSFRLPPRPVGNTGISPAVPAAKPLSPLFPNFLDDETLTQHGDETHRHMLQTLQTIINELAASTAPNYDMEWRRRSSMIKGAIDKFYLLYKHEWNNLEQLRSTLKENTQTLHQEISKINEELDKDSAFKEKYPQDSFNLIDYIVAETVALNQLYELTAKHHAISDGIQLLSQMLNQGKISVDIFVKKTRMLARDQFLTKVHIDKIVKLLK
ncbi:ubiquitin-binding ESCRT-I subunit protein STP22 Ecym_1290 [Eremothecium cymbalariae DBVPG|uniref:UEV domain-containing protein n=1 Tax=Eremothecium cymbalariae (strain CBS 270.75 / DBVPG 7215 / KCTC 17166 / NRRL Y-17582) TaxID=931890 RepID=G8JN65_ERECY|nr:hypothetical protein Ecym_1290 [Eremothecium cymbalariae DBVPG\